jgi:uncharacterized membrane protein YedE/YeeE
MRDMLSSLVCGLLLGAGLAVSGMINPAKVLNFLDIAGTWDPTLGFVMGGAQIVSIPGYLLVRRRHGPLLGGKFHMPTKTDLDPKLIAGAVLFGLGWGLAGFCPGPAFAALSTGYGRVAVFVVAMAIGMTAYHLAIERRSKP